MRSADAEPPPADPPEPTPSATSSDATPKPTRMLRSERQAGVAVAGVLVAAVALSSFGAKSITPTQAAIGVGFIALLGVAVWYGQRILGSIAAMMAGLAPMKPAFAFLPFASLAFGGYLMFRTSKDQKKAAVARPRRPRGAKAGPRSVKDATDAGAVKRPTANRRYTPPKSKGATRRR